MHMENTTPRTSCLQLLSLISSVFFTADMIPLQTKKPVPKWWSVSPFSQKNLQPSTSAVPPLSHPTSCTLTTSNLHFVSYLATAFKKPDLLTPDVPSSKLTLRLTLISSSHLCSDLPSGLFLLGFLTKTLHIVLYLHSRYKSWPSHPQFYHHSNICWRVQTMKLNMKFSLALCYFLSLRFKHSSHYPVLKQPQSAFFP